MLRCPKLKSPIAEFLQADQKGLYKHCQKMGNARGKVHYPYFQYRTYTRNLRWTGKVRVASCELRVGAFGECSL